MTDASRGPAAGRLSVAERLTRLLGVIPWVVARGGAHLDEISNRFDYPREQLLNDLNQVVFFVGVHPFTPDALIEVFIVDEIVEIRYADWFSRPLRLTADEATRLLAAGRSVLALTSPKAHSDESEESDPLMRALAKLQLALGGVSASHIDISLGAAPTEIREAVHYGAEQQLRIEIEYYTLGRDVLTRRVVDPARMFSHDGEWYLHGWCHRAAAERVFRVDRIRSAKVTDTPVEVALDTQAPTGAEFEAAGSSATLRLDEDHAWAADYYPTRRRTDLDGGRVEATFAVANTPWLARRLLQFGLGADMTAHDESIDPDLRADSARQVLERYGK